MVFVGRGGVKVLGMHFMSVCHVTALIKNKKEKSSNLQYCYLALHEKKTQGISRTLKFATFLRIQKFKFSGLFFIFYKIS